MRLASSSKALGGVAFGGLALFALALTGVAAGCLGVDPPEGRLLCSDDDDCPDGWFCHLDNSRCYRSPDEDGADAGTDGGMGDLDAFRLDADQHPDAFAVDAPGLDAGLDAFMTGDTALDAPGDAGPPPADAFLPPDAYSECDVASDCTDPDTNLCTGVDCVGHLCVTTITDCDDGVSCTNDGCFPATGCQHLPDMALCSGGQVCHVTRGCEAAGSCGTSSECDDGFFCTTDLCTGGHCTNTAMACPDDSSACTVATCNETTNACENPFDATSLSDVTHCGTEGGVCTAPCLATAPHTVATCTGGACGTTCATGYYDLDSASPGCEYMCTPTGVTDPLDDVADANCDGADGVVGSLGYVYVMPGGASSGPGDRPSAPVNLTRAIAIAMMRGGPIALLLQSGTYNISAPIDLPDQILMWGGYASDYRTRSGHSLISSSALGALVVTQRATIDSIDVTTADQSSAGAYTRTIWANGTSGFVLRNSVVTAGRGGPGSTGATGTMPTGTPPRATNGTPGTITSGGTGGGPTGSPASGGQGGSPAPGGGIGGVGVSGCNSASTGGRQFNATVMPAPCVCGTDYIPPSTSSGGDGAPGCTGGTGMQGGAGSGAGTIGPVGWAPAVGGMGGVGLLGVRGAGGGGGGGGACFGGPSVGGGGGGQGGEGGMGGGGGSPGLGGGGSFAILARTATLTLTNVRLVTR
ncbi:MAG: hypothetical protein K1X94_06255, partial [Sandaracinaceae bacterium]|nr:hypothetical protein [Sandaracinaceae bacterium]